MNNTFSRRDFLKSGAVTLLGSGLSVADSGNSPDSYNCIILFLTGGPSHLDTLDMKPDAPAEIRGPFRPIQTNVPGVQICEHFPRMAQRADKYSIVRSVYHDAAPIHETGCQLLQTGRVSGPEFDYPNMGAVLAHQLRRSQRGTDFQSVRDQSAKSLVSGEKNGFASSNLHGQIGNLSHKFVPVSAIVPGPIEFTGVGMSHGQGCGFLDGKYAPVVVRDGTEGYGTSRFGRSCLAALQLVEQGVRLVTVNMFDTVFNEVTWDCHADGGSLATSLDDYEKTLCPMFDMAYSGLLDDLEQRGLLETTAVIAMGEFGRTPLLNSRGGRDHWPGAWSILVAGGPFEGGQIIGATDKWGEEPVERPIHAGEIAGMIKNVLGIDGGVDIV